MLFEQMVLQELSEQEYMAMKAEVENELVRLREVQATVENHVALEKENAKIKSANVELAHQVQKAGQISSELVDALIERVYVYPEHEIEIVWKVKCFYVEES